MATQTTTPVIDPETVAQLRSERESGLTLAELRKAFPSLSLATIKKAVGEPGQVTAVKPAPKLAPEEVERRKARAVEAADHEAEKATTAKKAPAKAKAPVTTKRVAPVEPDYTKLPEGKREAARKAYEAAIAKFEGKAPAKSTAKSSAKATGAKAPKASAAKAPAKPRKPRAVLAHPARFKSWDDPKLAAFVLREKGKGQTIKAIAATLDLPAEERFWHRVSLVFRAAADAKGIARPKLSAEAIEARKAAKAS